MDIHSALKRLPATAVAAIFTAGGLRLVLGESLMHPYSWTDYQILTLLLVTGTIGAGHFTKTAWQAGAILSCLGFALVFATGTYLAARQSLDRQAETAASSTLSAQDVNDRLATKADDLRKAKARKDFADGEVQRETRNSRCGQACRDWKQNSADIAIVIASLEAEISALGPRKPVNAGREHFGETAAAMGYSKSAAMGLDALLMPFLKFFVFEIGSIVSLGFALRHAPVAPVSAASASIPETMFSEAKIKALQNVEVSPLAGLFSGELPDPTPPKPRKRKGKPETAKVIQFPARHPVIEALDKAGGSVSSNRQLANLMGVTEGESTKRVQEVAGMVSIEKHGKQIKISLRKIA